MKFFILVLMLFSVFGASTLAMIYGWGIDPKNWGWILFSYAWSIVAHGIVKIMEQRNEGETFE